MSEEIEKVKKDFLVVGSGIAGLYTSLYLSNLGDVEVITKSEIRDSSTQYAQGGIAAVLDKGDSWQLHMEDTLEAGDGFCDEEAVELLVTEGPDRVLELIELGTDFDYIEGELDLAQEGAHSRRRILHARGDATGEEIRESLTGAVRKKENITLRENIFLNDLITTEKGVKGALCWIPTEKGYIVYNAPHVILATGGCGQIYDNTTNPEVTTGDGVAVAYRAGADITDMEFIQFHPTALYNPDGHSFLISETVRGEGGYLRNGHGERFMKDYHEDAELAPRDVVARAIMDQIEDGEEEFVWLDVTHLDSSFLKGRFPNIYRTLNDMDIDMGEEMIPVIPSAHYMIGGVKTDMYGRTGVPGLYACGEVASTGVHGANRLASNSLLEGIVFGHRIYQWLEKEGVRAKAQEVEVTEEKGCMDTDVAEIKNIREEMRERMMKDAGIKRSEAGLTELSRWLEDKLDHVESKNGSDAPDIMHLELVNMLTVGRLIARSALLREESRGAHHRTDFPEANEKYRELHTVFNKKNPGGI